MKQDQNTNVGIELRKIVPSRLQNYESPTQKSVVNQLLDMKVLKDQWNISRPQNIQTENAKDDEVDYDQKNSNVNDIFQRFGNVHQNTYSKNLNTENLMSPRKKLIPKHLSISRRQIDEKNVEIKKQEELDGYQKRNKNSYGNGIFSEQTERYNGFDEDGYNFINLNMNSFRQNNAISPTSHLSKDSNYQQIDKIYKKRMYAQIRQSQQQQEKLMQFNSNNNYQNHNSPFDRRYKQNSSSYNSYLAIQQQFSNQDKTNRFILETIQLAPVSKSISKSQILQQRPIMKIAGFSNVSNNQLVQEQILGYKLHQPYEQEVEEQLSDIDYNEFLKQDEINNININSIQLKTEPQSQKLTKLSEKLQKDYKIRKCQVKRVDPYINALGKSYSIYFEQHYVNRLPKDKQQTLKISAFRDFLQAINFCNKIYMQIPEEKQTHPIYKAFVGKGNNQMLIRMVIKQRWWWIISDSKDDPNLNLIWTQLRKNDVLSTIRNLKQELASSRVQRQQSFSSIPPPSVNQQSPTNSFYQQNNQTGIFSPSNSQINFVQDGNSKQQQQQTNQAQTAASTQSLFGSQSESTTDESTELSSSNLNQITVPKQAVRLNKQQQQLKKLANQSDFNALNSLLSNRQGKKFDSQAFSTSKIAKTLQKEIECKIYKDPTQIKIHNHLQDNFHLSNKKALFYNMRSYYESNMQNPFDFIPLTFHIQEGKKDKEYFKFISHYNSLKELSNNITNPTQNKKEQNIWIVKPGEITNRGSGIKVLSEIEQIEQIIDSNEYHKSGMRKTYIIQKYIEYPLLYFKRKFDIRCYYLLTSINGYLKGYWYQDGYIRTASKEFTTKNLGKMIHLTNDAVQKKDDQYGKYEKGNKVSYDELDKYITSIYPEKDFYNAILPQMKEIGKDTMKAVYGKIDPEKKESTIEVFGLDFMIDDSLKVWLIEVNTNPALDICCPLLSKIIPQMIENTFRIAIDPLFPPPSFSTHKNFNFENILENNKYELIFDEVEDSKLIKLTGKDTNLNWQMIEEELDEDEDNIVPE